MVGQVNVIGTAPRFGNVQATISGLVLSGSGGAANSSYYLLSATNLTTPLANWTRVLTNQFDASGHFSVTDSIAPHTAQQFYLLETP